MVDLIVVEVVCWESVGIIEVGSSVIGWFVFISVSVECIWNVVCWEESVLVLVVEASFVSVIIVGSILIVVNKLVVSSCCWVVVSKIVIGLIWVVVIVDDDVVFGLIVDAGEAKFGKILILIKRTIN